MRDRLFGAIDRVPVWLRIVVAIAAFASVGTWLTVTTWHTLSTSRSDIGPLTDFRDAIYYPVVALRDGVNPYNVDVYYRLYPVGQEFPLYTPVHLLLNAPLLLFSFPVARAVNFGWNLLLVLGLAVAALRLTRVRLTVAMVVGLATLILLSDPGRFDLRSGQPTLLLVIATYVALGVVTERIRARGEPIALHVAPLLIGAVAIAVVWSKPTFAIPLAVLLVATGRVRLAAYGTALGVALSAAVLPTLVHAAGGIDPLVTSWRENARITSQSPQSHLGSGLRIDIGNTFVRVTHLHPSEGLAAVGGLVLLVVGASVIWRLHRADPAGDHEELVVTFAVLLMLTSMYRVSYDYLLLTGPLVMLARRAPNRSIAWPHAVRSTVFWLLLLPVVDPLGWSPINAVLGKSGFEWMFGPTMMAIYVVAALVLCAWTALRQLRSPRPVTEPTIPVAA
ncbi:MAG: glycosyltransferase 87 family protein [Acidimicrobiia bacterium]